MPITRAKAERLLNKTEMGLYDDSRVNALRRLDAAGLARRVERTRAARDRARDLVKRQKLASRERTGSKRGRSGNDNQRSKDKAEVLADILGRFEAALRQAKRGNGAARTTGRGATKAAPASAAGKAARERSGRSPRKAADRPAKQAARRTTKKKAAKKATGKAATASKRGITPQQALDNTRTLLEARHARAREPKPWQAPHDDSGKAPQPGYQSSTAARRAEELHAGESRLPAIQGSIGTRDRLNQGKRDHRRSDED